MNIAGLLLLISIGALPQQTLESQLRQQQQLLQEQRQELQELQRQVERSLNLLQEIRREQDAQEQTSCSAQIRWVGGAERRSVPPGDAVSVQLNLFSTVSRPSGNCLPAAVRMTASYLDANDNLVCTGVIQGVARQNSLTESINLEVRPWDFGNFVWWRNEPPQTNIGPKDLFCFNPDGQAQATRAQLERVVSVRIWTTVLPPGGGLSTAELQLDIQR